MLPLHERFPDTRALPHVTLADLPTPVKPFELAVAGGGVASLWAKCDDRVAEPYGGNKVRKLEFTLGQALAEGRRAVITFGAAGSNHVLATAIHGTRAGLEVHAVLTPQAMTRYLRANVLADITAGAALHSADSSEHAQAIAEDLRSALVARDGVDPLVIPVGGSSAAGTLGSVNAGLELAAQVGGSPLPEPDVAYVALGSTGTAVGLAIGLAAAGMRTRVVGVRVVPESVGNAKAADALADAVVALLRSLDSTFPALASTDLALDVREGFFGDGYAVPTAACIEAVALAERAGLRLETTYTGKALAALIADARAGALEGRHVLFWNTYNSQPLKIAADVRAVPEGLREVYFDDTGNEEGDQR